MNSLWGVVVVLVGLAVRLNPLLVVTAGALVTGLAGGLDPLTTLAALGKGFREARTVSIAFLILPMIGVLERAGLQARAREVVSRLRSATPGRLLLAYLALRQVSAALGLMALGGQAGMVRPLIAPMAESLLPDPPRNASDAALVRAHAAAADNIGAFFGEDIFIALGSVLLIQAVLAQNHLHVLPARIAAWAIPTALVAFAVHGARLIWLDRRLQRAAPAPIEDAT
ncbi:MAG TPA: DUF969 family protein [Caulobacteraceae bacterium]|jgi:uncharacterized membrane protein|nr:DUF969 family protein [Caulobacteraceae bacterium]